MLENSYTNCCLQLDLLYLCEFTLPNNIDQKENKLRNMDRILSSSFKWDEELKVYSIEFQ